MEYKLGIVILNYNSKKDTLSALESLKKYTHIEYKVCIADNSNDLNKRVNNDDVDSSIVDILYLDKNNGYASGNNEGIKYLVDQYNPPYILIMNPDVTIIEDNTIDDLVYKLSEVSENNICGIQPLVWTPRLGNDPTTQINIRSVKYYHDCCISSFHLLSAIFYKRSQKLVYKNEMPYVKDLTFEVPSGCFFITRTDLLRKVDYFDDRTFLFNEEYILGYKLHELGYKFYFYTRHKVQHEQGASTGANKKKVSFQLTKYEMESLNIYLKHYLKVGCLKILFVDILIYMNFIGRLFRYKLIK